MTRSLCCLMSALIAAGAISSVRAAPPRQESPSSISLAGKWRFAFDPQGADRTDGQAPQNWDDTIALPATTEEADKGKERVATQDTGGLTRRRPFEGIAWYRRTFVAPASWAGREVVFFVERTKKISVALDSNAPIDDGNALSTSHEVHLGKIAPGEHVLTICVDNRISNWPDRVSASHMLENSTQTNWNGLLGRLELRTEESFAIQGVCAGAAGGDPHRLHVRAYFDQAPPGLKLKATLFQNGRVIGQAAASGDELTVETGKTAKLWDEFHPNVCRLEVEAAAPGFHAVWSGATGLRDFRSQSGSFLINGSRTFLRGKHDACVFPLTGHPPMEEAGWDRYLRIVKSYGLNHIRFHSWCPPDAAFAVADRLGVYLQPELPFWGDPSQPGVEPFLTAEGLRILREYGAHPSFVMLSIGNEYWGAAEPRPRIVAALRALDGSRLYDEGSNTWFWDPKEYPGTDYTVSAFSKKGESGKLRGSYTNEKDAEGYIQVHAPGTSHTYSEGLSDRKLPFVSHEVGQYQVFPNFQEMAKYTGVLRADNFQVFQDRLAAAGMGDQAEDFRQASGRLALQCYREEIEAALRTPEMDGFQLLDLQDYPGQGTALVGMLDAFMDSKGFVTPEEWRAFCAPVVPLALFPKYTWRADETFRAETRIANYGPGAVHGPVQWELRQGARVLAHQTLKIDNIPNGGVTPAGEISAPLQSCAVPGRIELTLTVAGKSSTWPLWIYPAASASFADAPGVTVSSALDPATLSKLASGGSVLYIPAASDLPNSFPGYFTPDFWCYQMFKGNNPPGTLGLLIQDKHPALSEFPTRAYSEWQWQDLAHHSRAVILDKLSGYKPIVQPIDNTDRNHRLGSLFELKVGAGKLLVCAFDLREMKDAPEAAQLMKSLMDYVGSDRFQPKTEITPGDLIALLGK